MLAFEEQFRLYLLYKSIPRFPDKLKSYNKQYYLHHEENHKVDDDAAGQQSRHCVNEGHLEGKDAE